MSQTEFLDMTSKELGINEEIWKILRNKIDLIKIINF